MLRYSLEPRSPGCLHFVLECVATDPPLLLENRSGTALQFRQAAAGPAFSDLPAYSAAGFAWPSSRDGANHEASFADTVNSLNFPAFWAKY